MSNFRHLLHVRNVPWTVSPCQFESYFSSFGKVKKALLLFDENGINTGNGSVEYYDRTVMLNVLAKRHVLENRKIHVNDLYPPQ